MQVTVKIIYLGRYSQKAGVLQEKLCLSENINEAYEDIREFLQKKYGFAPPFNLLLNGTHITGAIKKNITLKDDDEFKLLPFLSGG